LLKNNRVFHSLQTVFCISFTVKAATYQGCGPAASKIRLVPIRQDDFAARARSYCI
jgi:hypothetical protein